MALQEDVELAPVRHRHAEFLLQKGPHSGKQVGVRGRGRLQVPPESARVHHDEKGRQVALVQRDSSATVQDALELRRALAPGAVDGEDEGVGRRGGPAHGGCA